MDSTTLILLLRGINVSGANKVPMADLRSLLAASGFSEVRTYIQSGNVVCEGDPHTAAHMASEAITARFGLDIPVVTRTRAELDEVINRCPFDPAGIPGKYLHVLFLDRYPDPGEVTAIDPDHSPPDEARCGGREVYVHYPGGSGRSKLTVDYIERILHATATARNWNTVLKLAEMAHEG